ncbi:MAG: hypothetical protein A3G75_06695 [Verrucomicrobia bacterium RIFCSPLOWO2_12_FULL_64_8]|nr:MAG: hypothetical protein A3G75_06695 [Verrucomicrobia bacterium RIFCSPLOWO2_12_FULL_64_8]
MSVIGLELCDAGMAAAIGTDGAPPELLEFDPPGEVPSWPGMARSAGGGYVFGREAEAAWFTEPHSVSHAFWDKLSLEPADLTAAGKTPTYSELAYHSLHDFTARLVAKAGRMEKIALAVPGAFLKDATTEEVKIGLLLGMARELGLPLVRIVDLACAAAIRVAAHELPRGLCIAHVDLHLQAAEVSILQFDERLTRRNFLQVPQAGLVPILRHLKNTMGNRFLRTTTFDIHEDRRLEQTFYEQTKALFYSNQQLSQDHLFQIGTGRRSYQMAVTRTQLAADLQSIVAPLVQSIAGLVQASALAPSRCVVTLSDRAARLDGLDARLRAGGFRRVLRLRAGAAATETAMLARESAGVPDLGDVPVETSLLVPAPVKVPVATALCKAEATQPRPPPSHVILDGIGYAIGGEGLRIGTGRSSTFVDVVLPESFNQLGDYVVRLVREGAQLCFEAPSGGGNGAGGARDEPNLIPVEAGDRLALRSGPAATELLFAFCNVPGSPRKTPDAGA